MTTSDPRLRPAAVAAALLVALFAVGSVTQEGLALTLGALAVCVVFVMGRRAEAPALPRAARRLSIVLWTAAACALVQLLPLPRALVAILSPHAVALRDAANTLLGVAPASFLPLTLDVPGTAFAVATAVAVAVAFDLTAHVVVSTQRGPSRVGGAVALVVIAFAAAAILHSLVGAEKLFGIYKPREALPSQTLMPAVLNPNQAAAVACVGPPMLLAIAIHSQRIATRVACVTAAILTASVAVLTMSRGGIAVLAAEVVAVVAFGVVRARGARREPRAYVAAFGVLVVGAIGLIIAHVAAETFVREASNTDLSKLDQAAQSYTVIRDFPLIGVGRGAFESVFPAYEMPLKNHARITNPEHWPAQLLTEFGVPLTIAGVVAVLMVARHRLRTPPRSPVQIGAIIAIGGLLVHDLADFALEFAGAATLGAAVTAVVLVDESRSRAESVQHRRVQLRALGGLTVAAALLFATHRQLNSDEIRAVSDAWRRNQVDEAALVSAIGRHPGEPFFPLVIAAQLEDAPSAGRWFVHAVKLAPNRAQTRFWFARWLARTGRRPQAWAEYAAALRLAPPYAQAIVRDLVAFRAPVDDVVAVTQLPLARELVSRELTTAGRDDEAARVDEATTAQFPPAFEARLRAVHRHRAVGDATGARRLAEELAALAPTEPRAYLALADTAATPDAAESALERGLSVVGDRPELLEALVRLRVRRVGIDSANAEIDRLRAALVLRDGSPHRLSALLGDIEAGRGHHAGATRHYQDAAAAAPDPTEYLERAAAVAERGGLFPTAIECLRRLVERHPTRTRYAEDFKRVSARQAAAILVPSASP